MEKTPRERLIYARETVGWSRRHLAKLLRRPESTVRQWESGATRVPDEVLAWLERLAEAHRHNPPP